MLEAGKYLSCNWRNIFGNISETLRLNCGLNHMMFEWRFCLMQDVASGLYLRFIIVWPLCFRVFSYFSAFLFIKQRKSNTKNC